MHLQDQQVRIEHLIGLLGRERELLGQGTIDGEALGALAIEKQHVLADLADSESRHRDAHAWPDCGTGVADDAHATRGQDCHAQWQQLRDRASEAARLNDFNGQLINLRLTSNQRLLNDLRTLAGADLYGPDGQARAAENRLASKA